MPLVDIIVDIKQRILVKIIGDRLEKVAKTENISKSELNQAKMLQKKKSIDELREIATILTIIF